MARSIRTGIPQLRVAAGIVVAMLLALPSPAAPPTVPPAGTYRYDISTGGTSTGTSTIVVRRDGAQLSISENALWAGVTSDTQRTLDPTMLATLSYEIESHGKAISVAVVGNTATMTVDGAPAPPLVAPDGAPIVVHDNLIAAFVQIPATVHATSAKQLTFACVCSEKFVAVPVTIAKAGAAVRPANVPQGDVATGVAFAGMSGTLWYDPQTFAFHQFDFPSQKVTISLRSYASVLPLPATEMGSARR